jgi:hypothetical protein
MARQIMLDQAEAIIAACKREVVAVDDPVARAGAAANSG